jgi:hypothetical protein
MPRSDLRRPEVTIEPMTTLLTYSLEFRGEAVHDGDGFLLRASAPSCTHETRLAGEGIVARFLVGDCNEEAFLEGRLLLSADGRFSARVTIDFGHGHRLEGVTLDAGLLTPSADEHLHQGTATIQVVGGSGQFEGASGRITSNFVLSDTGELTDNQLGMVFLRAQPQGEARVA